MAKKPKPAPIYDKKSQSYRLNFYYNGKQYRTRYIRDDNVANTLQSKVNSLVIQFKNGLLTIPEGVPIGDFIFGSIEQRPKPEEVKTNTATPLKLSQLIEEYLKISIYPIKAHSTCALERVHIRHLRRFVGEAGYNDPMLPEITVGFFNKYKQHRYKKDIRTDTVKKELSTFQSIFRMAVENGYIKYNIVRDVKREKSQVPYERFRTHSEIIELLQNRNYDEKEIKNIQRFCYLQPDEISKLILLAKDHWLYPILKTFAYTGVRRGELLNLQWRDINLDKREIYVRSKKQSQKLQETVRHIPITEELHKVLVEQKLKTSNSCWVFPGPNGGQLNKHTLSDAIRRLIKGTEFEGIGCHMFRHSLASNLAAIGEDQRKIDKILGHQTEAMRQRYQHLFPKQLEIAIDKIGYM